MTSTEANAEANARTAERIAAQQGPALSLQERDRILRAAQSYAAAARAHQRALDLDNIALEEANAAESALTHLQQVANEFTTTSVNQELLDRTLERNAALDEVEQLTARVDRLLERGEELARARDRATGERDALRERDATSATLSSQLDGVIAERDDLQRRLSNTAVQLARTDGALDRFRQQVQEVAYRYAEKHGWCETVDEAMRELGLERAPQKYTATLVITVDFHATLAHGKRGVSSEGWVLDSLTGKGDIRDAIRESLGFDSDHEDGDVDDIEFDVRNVREDNDD